MHFLGYFCVLLFLNLVKYQSGKFVLPLFCLKKVQRFWQVLLERNQKERLSHMHTCISSDEQVLRLILRVGEVLGLHFVVHDLSMGRSLLMILLLVQPGTRTYTHCYRHKTMKQLSFLSTTRLSQYCRKAIEWILQNGN